MPLIVQLAPAAADPQAESASVTEVRAVKFPVKIDATAVDKGELDRLAKALERAPNNRIYLLDLAGMLNFAPDVTWDDLRRVQSKYTGFAVRADVDNAKGVAGVSRLWPIP